jgi:hypothetical protein
MTTAIRGASAGLTAGVEHEYRIWQNRLLLDARTEVDGLSLGPRLDPADPHAQRLPSGCVLTADGMEFEVATPPVAVSPGFASVLDGYAGAGRAMLLESLGDDVAVEGFSTHINVSVPDPIVVEVGGLFVRRFGPALMLLMDAQTSPGVFVRPRHGRLEIGGEFVEGRHLAASLLMAIGAVQACVAVVRRELRRSALPRVVRCSPVPTIERFGWYLDRGCFGTDLYSAGSSTSLRHRGGSRVTAGDHLRVCWEVSRYFVAGEVDASELAVVDGLVGESLPRAVVGEPRVRGWDIPADSIHGRVTVPIARPEFVARAVAATWAGCGFEFTDGESSVFCTVPASELEGFHAALVAGVYDQQIDAALRSRAGDLIRS